MILIWKIIKYRIQQNIHIAFTIYCIKNAINIARTVYKIRYFTVSLQLYIDQRCSSTELFVCLFNEEVARNVLYPLLPSYLLSVGIIYNGQHDDK